MTAGIFSGTGVIAAGSGTVYMVVCMGSLTIFGLFAVTAMLVFYALEERNTFYILCFAGACALGSIYGFLQGAYRFWAVISAVRQRVAAFCIGRLALVMGATRPRLDA